MKSWRRLNRSSYVHIGTLAFMVVAAVSAGYVSQSRQSGLTLGSATSTGLAAPTKLQAATGGGNVAIRWTAVTSPPSPHQYRVFRNGVAIATLTVADAPPASFGSTVYYDQSVSAGQTYRYQVAAVNTAGQQSAASETLSVKVPPLLTPVPVVTIDVAGQNSLEPALQAGAATIRHWYAKIADALTNGQYAVPSAIKLQVDTTPTCTVDRVVGSVISVCARHLRDETADMAIFARAAAQIVQQSPNNAPPGLASGITEWASHWATGRTGQAPATTDFYGDNPAGMAYFLDWVMMTQHQPNLVQNLNLAIHNGVYSTSLFRQYAGRSIGQLWSDMSGHQVTSPGAVTGLQNMCVDVPQGDTAPGRQLQLSNCSSAWAQQFAYVSSSASPSTGQLRLYWASDKCVVPNGAKAVIGPCAPASPVNQWQPSSDGALINVSTGTCLRPSRGRSASGTLLELTVCRSTAADPAQRWTLPAD